MRLKGPTSWWGQWGTKYFAVLFFVEAGNGLSSTRQKLQYRWLNGAMNWYGLVGRSSPTIVARTIVINRWVRSTRDTVSRNIRQVPTKPRAQLGIYFIIYVITAPIMHQWLKPTRFNIHWLRGTMVGGVYLVQFSHAADSTTIHKQVFMSDIKHVLYDLCLYRSSRLQCRGHRSGSFVEPVTAHLPLGNGSNGIYTLLHTSDILRVTVHHLDHVDPKLPL